MTGSHEDTILRGSVICPGVGIGCVEFVDMTVSVPHRSLAPEAVDREQGRYSHAIGLARRHVKQHVEAIYHDTPEHSALVIDAHGAILRDEMFHDAVRGRIAADLKNAEWALEEEGERLMAQFEAMRDPFFQARVEDVRDVVTEILDVLVKGDKVPTHPEPSGEATVLVSPHLHPSAAMYAQRIGAAGFATESKALASHAAILLKGFGIPALGGVAGLVARVGSGERLVVDAVRRQVVLRPSPETLERCRKRRTRLRAKAESVPIVPCRSMDGTPVRLLGNIGNPEQVTLILQRGLEGVGLFRTEFFAMADGKIPTEDEQTAAYGRVITALEGRSVVIRTFDIGADKQISSLGAPTGRNPALGLRGIRRHLRRDGDEFMVQLRAVLRAAGDADVGVMVPMVTTVDDARKARRRFEQAKGQLVNGGTAHGAKVEFGAMIETPAAALQVGEILNEVDFVSVGTNDLLQYLMAADRDDEDVLDYADPGNPAFLWMLNFIIATAREQGREQDVSICGEIASRRHQIPALLRMGYRCFSISPVMADEIRDAVAKTDLTATA